MAIDPLDREALSVALNRRLAPEERQRRLGQLYADAGPDPGGLPPGATASVAPSLEQLQTFEQRSEPKTTLDALQQTLGQEPPSPSTEEQLAAEHAQTQAARQEGEQRRRTEAILGGLQRAEVTAELAGGASAQRGQVDPSQLQFASQGDQGQGGFQFPGLQLSRPRAVRVGTDTFQPVARASRKSPFTPEQQQDLTTENLLLDETEREASDKAFEAEQKALADIREREAQADAIRASIEQSGIERERQRQAEIASLEEDWQNEVDAAASLEVDPDEYYEGKGFFGKLMTSLALGLATAGDALNGGNAAGRIWEGIQNDIDRNLAKQKANIDQRREKAAQKRNLVDLAAARFASESAIDAAAREAAYTQLQNHLARSAEAAQDPLRKATYEQLQAQADRQRMLAGAELKRQIADDVTLQERFDPKRTVVVGGGTGLEGATKSREELNKFLKAHGYEPERYIPSVGGYALREDVAKDLNSKFASTSQMKENIREIVGMINAGESGALSYGAEEEGRMKSLVQNTTLLAKDAFELGVLSGDDLDLIRGVIPDPSSVTTRSIAGLGDSRAALNKSLEVISRGEQSVAAAHGVRKGPTPDQLMRLAPPTGGRKAK